MGDGLLEVPPGRLVRAAIRRENDDRIPFLDVAVKVQGKLPLLPEWSQHVVDHRAGAVEGTPKRGMDPFDIFSEYPSQMIGIPVRTPLYSWTSFSPTAS